LSRIEDVVVYVTQLSAAVLIVGSGRLVGNTEITPESGHDLESSGLPVTRQLAEDADRSEQVNDRLA